MPSSDSKNSGLYKYTPSFAAAVIFVALFGISTLYHTFQLFKNRTWFFLAFLAGAIFEVAGYVGRAMGSKEAPDYVMGPYILQTLTILLAPILFSASIYMVLKRVIIMTGAEKYSLIRATWLTRVFVGGDILSFLIQAAGASMLVNADTVSDFKNDQNIITGGLVVQLLFFGFFIVTTAVFHLRIVKNPTTRSLTLDVPWQRYLFVMYGAGALILVRSLFRVVEFVSGQNGPFLNTEVYAYIFDAVLMFIMMVLYNVFHPSSILTKRSMKADDFPEPSRYFQPLASSTESVQLRETRQMV